MDSLAGALVIEWSKDLDNDTNKAFVASFQAEYGRLPSLYASQGFDTANLLISAMEAADVSDADAFRAAVEAALSLGVRAIVAFTESGGTARLVLLPFEDGP